MILNFDLVKKFQRPVISLKFGDIAFDALIDTGAFVPVYTGNIRTLEAIGGKFQQENVSFSGFGGIFAGDLYRLDLPFGMIKYKQLPLVCAHHHNMPFSFVLSATMFSDFNYIIDNEKHNLIVDTRTDDSIKNLRYKAKNGNWIVLAGTE